MVRAASGPDAHVLAVLEDDWELAECGQAVQDHIAAEGARYVDDFDRSSKHRSPHNPRVTASARSSVVGRGSDAASGTARWPSSPISIRAAASNVRPAIVMRMASEG